MQRANREHWKQDRDKMERKTIASVQRKAANAASENVATAERIRAKLLKRIEREIDALPENIGTEMFNNIENLTYDGKRLTRKTHGGKAYKLRDLTAAYRDLTAGMAEDGLQGNGEVKVIIDV